MALLKIKYIFFKRSKLKFFKEIEVIALFVLDKIFKKRNLLYFSQRQPLDIYLRSLFLFLTFFIILLPLAGRASDPISLDFRIVDGNFHIEFTGANEWDYDLNRKEIEGRQILELRVPTLTLATQERIKKIPTNDVVESLFLEKLDGGSKDILSIFLKEGSIESFDYLTEKPSRLVIDLYRVKKVLAQSNKQKKSENITGLAKTEIKNGNRKPAGDDANLRASIEEENAEPKVSIEVKNGGMAGIFDGGDPQFERFAIRDHEIKEEAIVLSQENLYIPFPMLLLQQKHFDEIKSQPPVYEITPKDNPENKMARLVLTLFEKNRLAVCLKTANWFLEKYPKSEYEEIIKFLIGDVYFKMWEKEGGKANYDAFMQSYKETITKFPNSILGLRTKFLIGYSAYENKDYFGALRTFQGIVTSMKSSVLKDKAQLAAARSLMRLNQYDDSSKAYEKIEKEAYSEIGRVEAAFLKGDVFYMGRNFQNASSAYKEAALKYPQYMNGYPNAFYNLAESLFWQKLYKASLESYREFLARFPGHSHAPYAMTRAGETLEILGADPRRVMGAFLETYFRYGGTDGAAVARMRLLSNRMKQMKKKEVEKAIEEIQEISSRILLPQIDLFATIITSEGLSQRHEFERSIEMLLKWYQSNSATRDAILIRKRIVRHVNEKMEGDVENGNFLGALRLHNQYGELWLKGSGRIDTVYNLARAFEQAGAYRESDFLFRETANLLATAKSSGLAREHSVFEHLPTIDQVYLRLAKIKSELGETSKSYEYLREIKEPQKLTDEQQIERMEISVKLLKEKGDLEAAKLYLTELIRNWNGKALSVASVRRKLAEIEMQSKSYEQAETLLKLNISDLEDSEKIPSAEHLESQKLLSEVYLEANKVKENQSLLTSILSTYSGNETLGSLRFRLGKLFFQEGNFQKATEAWKPLDNKKQTYWWGLANNYLNEQDWGNTYKKYVQRIPAMAQSTGKGDK